MQKQFTFAGFNFPRGIASLPEGTPASRKGKKRFTSGYYHAPKPITKGAHPGSGFYLEDVTQPFTRWQWADDVINLLHTGYYADNSQCESIRGIVVRLAKGRGFLAGWSMGEGMASEIDGEIYEDEDDAARAADSMAKRAAEDSREGDAKYQAERQIEEARAELHRINKTALPLFAELRKGVAYAAPVCDAIRARIETLLEDRAQQFRIIEERTDNFWSAVSW